MVVIIPLLIIGINLLLIIGISISEFYGYNKFRMKLHIKCILVICICYYIFIAESAITEAQNDALRQPVSNKKYWCLVKMSEKLI